MPNRILKESIKSSHEIDQLSFFQECMFYRLIVSADDFGRYYGDPVLLRSFLFPRKENIKAADIDDALSVMNRLGLISLYQDDKGDRFLQFVSWLKHQQKRSNKSKFPDPALSSKVHSGKMKSVAGKLQASDISCNQMISNVPVNENENDNRERKTRTTTITRIESDQVDVDDDLIRIQEDHNEILNAAQAAGFDNQATWDKIIDLYVEYGREIVLAGISACVEQNVIKLSYLRKCCTNIASGNGKPAASSKKNPFAELREVKNDDQR